MTSKAFSFTYALANSGLLLYGIMVLFSPNILLDIFSQYVYDFPRDATNAIAYQSALFRLLGYFNILVGMLGLLFLRQWMVQHEKWIVRSLIVLTTLAYLGPIVFDNTVGHIGIFEIIEHVLLVAVVLTGFPMLVDRKTQCSEGV